MYKETYHNCRYPHHATIKRIIEADNFSEQESEEKELYDGRCHLFKSSSGFSTNQSESSRGVSIPVPSLGWIETPNVNDLIKVTINETTIEEGVITDVVPDNYRTMVYFTFSKL